MLAATNPPQVFPRVALTGGVGTGKSTALQAILENLSARGVPCRGFDADVEVRKLFDSDAFVAAELCQTYPQFYELRGGNLYIDREGVRREILPCEEKRLALEKILHPPVLKKLAEEQAASRARGELLVADIPLLFEIAAQRNFDLVVVVACSEETQRRRLMENRGLSFETVAQFFSAQWPIEKKVELADFVLWNDGAPTALQRQCSSLCDAILGRPTN